MVNWISKAGCMHDEKCSGGAVFDSAFIQTVLRTINSNKLPNSESIDYRAAHAVSNPITAPKYAAAVHCLCQVIDGRAWCILGFSIRVRSARYALRTQRPKPGAKSAKLE